MMRTVREHAPRGQSGSRPWLCSSLSPASTPPTWRRTAASGDATTCAKLSARHMSHVALTLFAHLDAADDPTEVRVALELAGFVLEGED